MRVSEVRCVAREGRQPAWGVAKRTDTTMQAEAASVEGRQVPPASGREQPQEEQREGAGDAMTQDFGGGGVPEERPVEGEEPPQPVGPKGVDDPGAGLGG